ncbi:alpha/beta hydrolase [Flavobacteriaceae bacterium]|nr:alpha/beta hydrolase [Flavobacteriaceae bacterium]MDB0022797.1 alpha/beta hydrolase [Flavobacteriaceae bacterium]MDC1064731.1 alpha/beta hydrolase [Flavobacteriaceae bacterium]
MIFLIIVSSILFGFYIKNQLKDNLIDSYIDKLISITKSKQIPTFVSKKTGYAKNIDVKIFYEDLCNIENPKGTVLLINGAAETMIQWPDQMIRTILKNGFRVIRFDNRGLGKSDWIKDWSKSNSYNLEEMARDALAITSHLMIKKFHVIGYSTGGMIAQILAINHPEKIITMTNLMSTGYLLDPEAEKPDSKRINQLKKLIFSYKNKERNIDKVLKFHFKLDHLFVGSDNYVINYEKQIQKTLYEIKFRNGFNKKAFDQHRYAIKKSGSRYRKLKTITSPTLIIHGSDDTLIRPSHSNKIASLIHGSNLVIIKGMGHDFNKNFKNQINSIILPHILQDS